jgi:hypothetical protein
MTAMRIFRQLPVLVGSLLLTQQTWGMPLDSVAVAQQGPAVEYAIQEPPLRTPWTDGKADKRWESYPRPQLRREDWQSLNGIWRWQDYKQKGHREYNVSDVPKEPFDRQVLVPSCLESGLSGKRFLELHGRSLTWNRHYDR